MNILITKSTNIYEGISSKISYQKKNVSQQKYLILEKLAVSIAFVVIYLQMDPWLQNALHRNLEIHSTCTIYTQKLEIQQPNKPYNLEMRYRHTCTASNNLISLH